ncbi:hypothetical protein BU15DRAFT_78017 [Melanogaster broomeanus]|nr:hypothetical protein BU15DRAFT_78017 [Melanogaster broomeanus]
MAFAGDLTFDRAMDDTLIGTGGKPSKFSDPSVNELPPLGYDPGQTSFNLLPLTAPRLLSLWTPRATVSNSSSPSSLGMARRPQTINTGFVFFFIWLYTRNWWRLPPGIRGICFLLEIPKEKPWLKLHEFNHRYGDLACMSALGYYVILIDSAKIAEDLLENTPSVVSDSSLSVAAPLLSMSTSEVWSRLSRLPQQATPNMQTSILMPPADDTLEPEFASVVQPTMDDFTSTREVAHPF